MKERSLGPDAPAVPAVGFGAMLLSISGRPSEEQGIEVIRAALDAGVSLVDTSDAYCLDHTEIGHNERLVARALDSWSADYESVIVATKAGMVRPDGRWERDGRPEQIKRACDRSLEALGVERIDLYQFHAPDPRVPFAESIGAFAELREAGKIRWVGLSNVSLDQVREAQGIVPIQSVQNRLSPFFREALETGIVKYCNDKRLAFIAYSPLGGGRLNKKLPRHPTVREIAATHDATPHAVVLAWGLAQGSSVIVIPGARSVEHAVDSAGAADLELTGAELQAIDAAEFSTD